MGQWQVWIDTGGTFTDCLALDPAGKMRRVKVLSSGAMRGVVVARQGDGTVRVRQDWGAPDGFWDGGELRFLTGQTPSYRILRHGSEGLLEVEGILPAGCEGRAFEVSCGEPAPILAARLVSATAAGKELPPMRLRLATTRGTNALLERRGSPTALFITAGLGDVLEIGTQQRPDLFALHIDKPPPLYAAVVEVEERLDAAGQVVWPLVLDGLEEKARALVRGGIRSAAVALAHSYRNPEHEQRIEGMLRRCGFEHVSAAARLAPLIKLLSRAQTAVVDAYIGPVIGQYPRGVDAALPSGTLHVMTSAGGLLQRSSFCAKDSLLSGPAGGVVGAVLSGRQLQIERLIGFDMGGTSTDVSRFDGDFDYVFEHRVGDAQLVAPALNIETVAAGGGSICRFAEGRLRVGPQSAGAVPGPACYGAGGPLTLTDVNLLLGRLQAERFQIPLEPQAAQERLDEILRSLDDPSIRAEEVLEGCVDIANERMADAIRRISLQRGYDPADHALVAFGGAGAQHACGVARRLGIERVVVPVDAGLLSAWGLGHAVIERFAERQVLLLLDEVVERLPQWFDELAEQAREQILSEAEGGDEVHVRRRILSLRLAGQEAALGVEFTQSHCIEQDFISSYKKIYGYEPKGRAIELESMRVVASTVAPEAGAGWEHLPADAEEGPQSAAVFLAGQWCQAGLYERSRLPLGALVEGPALVLERHSATLVEQGWQCVVAANGALVMECRTAAHTAPGRRPEAVRLELFSHGLSTIADQMGAMLQRTALSTNVKERLDFSCAILDAEARLVVNAPHIPVHLGAMGLCVRLVREKLRLGPGDTAITNHPAFGGSHLPDITLISAVHGASGKLLGYVASRAHHAEIGGIRPGSMPPAARCLAQEGVVIAPRYLARGGEVLWQDIAALLEHAPYPSRNIEENMADLRAALAANLRGRTALEQLAREFGEESMLEDMQGLRRRAAAQVRQALAQWPDGCYQATEYLDDGTPLQVQIDITGERACVDFSGSGAVHAGNLNATPAIVGSALIYVLRLLLGRPLPLNEGLMEPVEVILPRGVLNPFFGQDATVAPAVGGGNVETSQRLVDTLLKALGLAACSQGTMNNLLFGTEAFGYYETICGGSGAVDGFAGASAVHTHMTNTRITDPEILEHRYPVRLLRFSRRRGSGGRGRFAGGDGVVREMLFLADMSLSLLTQHRREGPYGMAGGEAGLAGRQWVVRGDGERVVLGAVDECEVKAGDRVVVETPGGGGWGKFGDG